MTIESIAEILDTAALQGKSTPQISTSHEMSLDEAYQVQLASLQRRYARGEKLIGLKMGFTSKAKMEQMGVHDLIWGRLTDKMLYESSSDIPLSSFIHPRAEPEIAFLISRDITEDLTLVNVKEYVSHVAVALEVIDSRYENFKFSLADVVADNCSSAAFSLGPWLGVETDINDILMSMVADDVIVGKGNSTAILGNPWESLLAAARLAKKYNEPIKEGFIILAGAASPAHYLKQGLTFSAHAERLGSVSLNVI